MQFELLNDGKESWTIVERNEKSEEPIPATGVKHTHTHQTLNHESRNILKKINEKFTIAMEKVEALGLTQIRK